MLTTADISAIPSDKNRYKDVLPSENIAQLFIHSRSVSIILDLHTRVSLFLKFGVPHSDYINANYIRVC